MKHTSASVTVCTPASLAALLMATDTEPMPPSTCLEKMKVCQYYQSNISSKKSTKVTKRTRTESQDKLIYNKGMEGDSLFVMCK